jgi:hypothetical protein
LAKNGSFGFAKGWLVCWAKQMCHLCGGNKIELKKCAVGKIKNTEGSAMSVGLLVVRLQYGLYVFHLSKFVTLFLFVKRSMSVVTCRFTLAANGLPLCEGGAF